VKRSPIKRTGHLARRGQLAPGRPKSRAKIPEDVKQRVIQCDGGGCVVCSAPPAHLHHVLPQEHFERFAQTVDNLIPLCFSCHWSLHYEPDGRLRWEQLPTRVRLWVRSVEADGEVWGYLRRTYPGYWEDVK
jgi:5-methylcytosine-specific restriction endonuclease McrA